MNTNRKFIYVLGIAQDGGYPHLGCKDKCCDRAWKNNDYSRLPTSIAYIDEEVGKYWLFDVSPRVKEQMHLLDRFNCKFAGAFITHAHYGHYIGLLEFGLEVLNTSNVPVYVMPRMYEFIINNSPFNYLVKNNNIDLKKIECNKPLVFDDISISSFEVPHRNELSETVGYKIKVKSNSAIYLPDIDTFKGFKSKLISMLKENSVVFLDGTFFTKKEITTRDFSIIPHPEVSKTIELLSDIDISSKRKINFIHFNHTNPLLNLQSFESKKVLNEGFSLSYEKQIYSFID